MLVPVLACLLGLVNSFRMVRLPDIEPSSSTEGSTSADGNVRGEPRTGITGSELSSREGLGPGTRILLDELSRCRD